MRSRSTARLSVSSFHPREDVKRKEKEDDEEEEEEEKKTRRERERRKEGKRETSNLVAESPCYEGAIERRNVVVVPGSVCTDGGGRWGEMQRYDRRRGRTRREGEEGGRREREKARTRERKKETD